MYATWLMLTYVCYLHVCYVILLILVKTMTSQLVTQTVYTFTHKWSLLKVAPYSLLISHPPPPI